jgi:energy-coupling factor transporter ATP-binding protein EcfA2
MTEEEKDVFVQCIDGIEPENSTPEAATNAIPGTKAADGKQQTKDAPKFNGKRVSTTKWFVELIKTHHLSNYNQLIELAQRVDEQTQEQILNIHASVGAEQMFLAALTWVSQEYINYDLENNFQWFVHRQKYESEQRQDSRYMSVAASALWIEQIFEHNQLNMREFFKALNSVLTKELVKKNYICLKGRSNSGKSKIARAITGLFPLVGECQLLGNNNFAFQDSVNKQIIIIEEPTITQEYIEKLKLIMEGAPTEVNQKCRSATTLRRTPLIFTTNNPLWQYAPAQSTAVKCRGFHFDLKPNPQLRYMTGEFNPACIFILAKLNQVPEQYYDQIIQWMCANYKQDQLFEEDFEIELNNLLQSQEPHRYFIENLMDRPTKWQLSNSGRIMQQPTEAQQMLDYTQQSSDAESDNESQRTTPRKRKATEDHTDSPAPKLFSGVSQIMNGDMSPLPSSQKPLTISSSVEDSNSIEYVIYPSQISTENNYHWSEPKINTLNEQIMNIVNKEKSDMNNNYGPDEMDGQSVLLEDFEKFFSLDKHYVKIKNKLYKVAIKLLSTFIGHVWHTVYCFVTESTHQHIGNTIEDLLDHGLMCIDI